METWCLTERSITLQIEYCTYLLKSAIICIKNYQSTFTNSQWNCISLELLKGPWNGNKILIIDIIFRIGKYVENIFYSILNYPGNNQMNICVRTCLNLSVFLWYKWNQIPLHIIFMYEIINKLVQKYFFVWGMLGRLHFTKCWLFLINERNSIFYWCMELFQ